MSDKETWKRAAAEAAAALVEDGMAVGLGTGSTAAHLVSILGDRVRQGLRIVAIPTSEATRLQAEAEGIRLVDFAECPRLDLTIDGADEIALGSLALIKGGGGALLREKIVASASTRMIVISDASKLVERLGAFPLPVEIVPFGWEATFSRLIDCVPAAKLRLGADGMPFVTDGGHYIVDCAMGEIGDAATLERDLDTIVGVVETGLFVGLAKEAYVADAAGVRRVLPEA